MTWNGAKLKIKFGSIAIGKLAAPKPKIQHGAQDNLLVIRLFNRVYAISNAQQNEQDHLATKHGDQRW